MFKIAIPVLLLFIVFVFAGATVHRTDHQIYTHDISICGTLPSDIAPAKDGKFIPVIAGTGHHHYTIRTTSDSAQIYFDQGLSFYYGYHFTEALASFKEAARFDPGCTMVYRPTTKVTQYREHR